METDPPTIMIVHLYIFVLCSSLVYEGGKSCDRFTVGIPYCGTQIECKLEHNFEL